MKTKLFQYLVASNLFFELGHYSFHLQKFESLICIIFYLCFYFFDRNNNNIILLMSVLTISNTCLLIFTSSLTLNFTWVVYILISTNILILYFEIY